MKHYIPGDYRSILEGLKQGKVHAESPQGVEEVSAIERNEQTRKATLTLGGRRVPLDNDARSTYSFYRTHGQ